MTIPEMHRFHQPANIFPLHGSSLPTTLGEDLDQALKADSMYDFYSLVEYFRLNGAAYALGALIRLADEIQEKSLGRRVGSSPSHVCMRNVRGRSQRVTSALERKIRPHILKLQRGAFLGALYRAVSIRSGEIGPVIRDAEVTAIGLGWDSMANYLQGRRIHFRRQNEAECAAAAMDPDSDFEVDVEEPEEGRA